MAAEIGAPAARALMERADRLATFSEEADRLTRRYGTRAHAEAAAALGEWMRAAGMSVRTDAVGNVIGRFGGADPDALVLGSHFDTVPGAGRYDGALGVLAAIATVERLRAGRARLPFALEVVAFADEEGARFGTAYLGSSVLAGSFDERELRSVDSDGVTLEQALRAAGGDPHALAVAARPARPLLGYAELHIEQGPVLEERGAPLGVVSGIAGQTRAAVRFTGSAGHAGTVPMDLRSDPLCAAAELVLEAEALARSTPGLVATVGELEPLPGAANVIPGAARMSLDVRHAEDPVRAAAVARLHERAAEIAAGRDVELDWEQLHSVDAVRCDPDLSALMADAVRAAGADPLTLASGAGHDAAVMAGIAPVAMLFVRCAGGISHHPDESVAEADVALALEALARFVEAVASRSGGAG